MRRIRSLTLVAALMAALPATVFAQSGRLFDDSWFWGIKVGGFTLADSARKYFQAPTVGLEWLITRSKGGLYISGSETFFSSHTLIATNAASGDTVLRVVRLKNMRKLDVAMVGFPGEHLRFHPYVGLGLSMTQAATAEPEGVFTSLDELSAAQQTIQNERVAFSPLLMGGVQYRMPRFSVFGQLMVSPALKNSILYNGRPATFAYEIGLRYNFGSSIDRN